MTEDPGRYMTAPPTNQHRPALAVKDVARVLGVTPQFLRLGLQQGRFPFGTAVKFRRWAYYINSDRFYAYVEEYKPVDRLI